MKMKKSYFLLLTGIVSVILLCFSGCESTNRADLDKLLSPSALPYLKPSKLIQVSSHDTTGGNNDRISIPSGKTATILNADGPGLISRIWFTIDSRDPYFLRRILIRMYWDDEENPSVEVPLGDFFGCGFEYQQYSTPFLGMTSGGYTCFFPMPFEESAKIDIVNETGQEIYAFYFQVDFHRLEKPISTDVGYFHAWWNRNIRTSVDSSYTVLKTIGKGHIVGVNLNMQSYDGGITYLEGDEKVYIDGEKKPSIHGTGTEDYFSSGWYFSKGVYAGPYNGLIYKNDSLGRIAAYRFHILDPISFKKSVKFLIEHGHADLDVADYSSTVYWYQLEPHKKFPLVPAAGLRIPLRSATPNKIWEAENLKFGLGNIPSKIMDMADHGPEWSGSKQLLIETQDKSSFTLMIPKLQELAYDIDIYYTKGPDYGNIGIYYKGQKLGEVKGYSPVIYPGGKIRLTGIPNPEYKIDLQFVVEGKDESSSGYFTGLDGISLNPKRTFIPDWYIIGPFANPRKTENLRLGLDSIYPPEEVVDLDGTCFGLTGEPLHWRFIQTPDNGYVTLTDKIKPGELVVCYSVTYIYSPREIIVPFYFGSDDGIKVFLNNKLIHRYLGIRVAEPDQSMIYLRIKKGWNKLLLKIENNFGGYGFYARILDRDHLLTISAEQENLIKKKK